jgi:ParB-like chromosome segregation protein Spo0J
MSSVAPGIIKARPSAYNLLDPRAIKRQSGFNPRFDFGEIAELGKSIRHQAVDHNVPGGLLQPLRVKRDGDGFLLIDGDRRLTAIEYLISLSAKGSPEGYDFPEGVPGFVVDKAQDDVTSLIQMFEANTGKSFLPLEEAAAFKRMQDAGLTIEQIGKAVQRAHGHIVATLALLVADESVKDAVKSQKIGGTLAKKIATAARGNLKKQAELVGEVLSAGKDAKKRRAVAQKIEAARVAAAASRGRVLKIRALSDGQLSDIGASLSKHLVTLIKEAKLDPESDLTGWAKADDKLAVAYTLGSLAALKVACGEKINLEI